MEITKWKKNDPESFRDWQDEDMWVGYLEEYSDYMTQGETLEELKENLTDIYKDLTNGAIPHVRKAAVRRIGGLKYNQQYYFCF